MKIKFENYTYWDKDSSDKLEYNGVGTIAYDNYKFDESYFNRLISERNYMAAADYASHFVFSGQEQINHENDIINLRRNGQILGAIYDRIEQNDPSGDSLKKISFYDSVFADGGLETLSNNPYAHQFMKYKQLLGSSYSFDGSIIDEATRLSIVFEPEKRYGAFGIDFLAADNQNNIDNFYKKINLTKEQLREAGVEVKQIDGKDILEFDKTNRYANLIIASCNSSFSDIAFNHHKPVNIIGYNANGEEIPITRAVGATKPLQDIDNLLEDARKYKESFFKKLNIENKEYSSAASPWLSDELMKLRETATSEEEYNKLAKFRAPHIFNAINALGSGNYEMYSNINNTEGDETLMPILDSKTKDELIGRITSTSPSKYQVDAMTSNGKVGALVTLYERRDNKGQLLYPRVQVFIPGLLQEEAQARLNRDTNIRAIQELNSMLDWGYSYKLDDGATISISPTGGFEKDGQLISKDDAIRDLNRNFILQDVKSNLKYNFISATGKLIDEDRYDTIAKGTSLKASAELYPGSVKSVSLDGSMITINNTVYSISDIFNDNLDIDNVPFGDWYIIQDIVSMYNSIMDDLTYYKE